MNVLIVPEYFEDTKVRLTATFTTRPVTPADRFNWSLQHEAERTSTPLDVDASSIVLESDQLSVGVTTVRCALKR